MEKFLQMLFARLGVRFTAEWLGRQVEVTPYAMSMYGLSVILSRYKIETECVRLMDKQEFKMVDTPCVVISDGRFVLAEAIEESSVVLSAPESIHKVVSLETFYASWNGVVLLIEAGQNSGEPDYEAHIGKERQARFKKLALTGCLTMLVVLGLILSPEASQWYWWALLAVNTAGLGVAYMLLQMQLHIPNRLVDKLCGLAKESHCEDVTRSEGASFLGIVKLSEIGAGFFCVNLLALLFFPEALFFVALVAACVLPFTFWSVWYQKRVARNWCLLCLCTLGVMWLQAGVCLAGGIYSMVSHQLTYALVLIAAYGASVLLINRLMDVLARLKEYSNWHRDYNYLKAQEEVVEAFESKAPIFDTGVQQCSSLIFGNPDASHRITVFSNPYCAPCAVMHQKIKDLPGVSVGISYVMTYFSEEASLINRYLIAAYQQLGPEKAWELMTFWHDGGKARGAEFFSGLGLDPETEDVKAELAKHDAWRRDDRLRGTPTVIVGNREVVMPYTIEDYVYFTA